MPIPLHPPGIRHSAGGNTGFHGETIVNRKRLRGMMRRLHGANRGRTPRWVISPRKPSLNADERRSVPQPKPSRAIERLDPQDEPGGVPAPLRIGVHRRPAAVLWLFPG
jgi:hypothetical protein